MNWVVDYEGIARQGLWVAHSNGHVLGEVEETEQDEVDSEGFQVGLGMPKNQGAAGEEQAQESRTDSNLKG